jgi:hypothetical protein
VVVSGDGAGCGYVEENWVAARRPSHRTLSKNIFRQ